jgi:sugar phosphate permease
MLVDEAGYTLVAAGVMLSLVQASGVGGRILWGWLGDRTRDSPGVLAKISMIMTACCVLVAFVTPETPAWLTALVFMTFGATAVGWNGVFMAEVARCSPRGLVSVATGGAMVWNFAGILIGPAAFATVYARVGSYAWTYGLLALVAAAGCVLLLLGGAASRRTVATH